MCVCIYIVHYTLYNYQKKNKSCRKKYCSLLNYTYSIGYTYCTKYKSLDVKYFNWTITRQKQIDYIYSNVSSIKAMMNEIMQIVAEKETIPKEVQSEEISNRFKEIEKVIEWCIN